MLLDDLDQVDFRLDLGEGVIGRLGGHWGLLCVGMARRSIVWVKEDGGGAEHADITIERDRLKARGTAFGPGRLGYRLDYWLLTGRAFVTTGLVVIARGDGWRRRLDLRRLRSGRWSAKTTARGQVDLPAPGGGMDAVTGALDCDLALSPLTNTMPVLRHGLLEGGGPIEFLMAWVSVPDLHVYPSRQRYTFVRRSGEKSIVRYESPSRDFVAELTFDGDGLCLDYPGIGRAV